MWLSQNCSDPASTKEKVVVENAFNNDDLVKETDDQDDTKPFFSSDEDQEINKWYEKQTQAVKSYKKKVKTPSSKYESCSSPSKILQNFAITEANVEAYDKPILSSPEPMNEATMEISGEYVPSSLPVIKKEPVWQVNMEVILVLIITLISVLPKCPRLKLTTASTLLHMFSPTTTACVCPVYDESSCAVFNNDTTENSVEAEQIGKNVFVSEDRKYDWLVNLKGVSSDPNT